MKDGKIGIAMIGCGQIANAHLKAMESIDNAELVSAMDVVEEKAVAVAQRYNANAYTSLEDVLNNDDVDAVILPLPHHLHHPVAIQCAKAGKHILVEKPMALNLVEAREMARYADNADVILMVGQSTRFRPEVWKAKLLIDDGRIGDILQCIHQRVWFLDKLSTDWRYSAEKCGGLYIPLFSSHDVDMVLWFMNKKPVSVHSILRSYTQVTDAESDGVINIELTNNAIATMAFSMNSHINRLNALFVGTKGTLLIDDYKIRLNDEFIEFDKSEDNFTRQMKEFVNSIIEGRTPLTSWQFILPVMSVLDAAKKSQETHSIISI